jgi:hypothetical protein
MLTPLELKLHKKILELNRIKLKELNAIAKKVEIKDEVAMD